MSIIHPLHLNVNFRKTSVFFKTKALRRAERLRGPSACVSGLAARRTRVSAAASHLLPRRLSRSTRKTPSHTCESTRLQRQTVAHHYETVVASRTPRATASSTGPRRAVRDRPFAVAWLRRGRVSPSAFLCPNPAKWGEDQYLPPGADARIKRRSL